MMIVKEQEMAEPLWMVAAADQRLAQMDQAIGVVIEQMDFDVIMAQLTDPEVDSDEARERWNTSCDHCKIVCPGRLVCGNIERQHNGRTVVITFGGCPECLGLA